MSKRTKEIIIGILPIIGTLGYLFFDHLIFSYPFTFLFKAMFFLLGFSLALGTWGIAAYLIEDRKIIHISSIFSALMVFIFSPKNIFYFITIILLIIYYFYAAETIRLEKNARIKILLDESASNSVKVVLSIFCLLFSLNYYNHYNPSSNDNFNTSTDKFIEKSVATVLPGFSYNTTVDDLTYLIMAKANGMQTDDEVQTFINQKKAEMSMEDFNKYKESIFSKIGIVNGDAIPGNEKIINSPFIGRLFNNRIVAFVDKYANLIKVGVSIAGFVAIIWLWKIFYPFIYLVMWGIYLVLKKIGFLQIEKHQVDAEKIIL